MDFLDRFGERDRERLLAVASPVRLARGELLIRRGEKGGDVYRVEEGELEVIDTRSQPAVVLDVMGRGAVVGEMAFLDETRRSADVRAADGATCQRWERPTLMRLLEQDALLAASFYRVIAEMVVERARNIVTNAVSGGIQGSGHGRGAPADGPAAEGRLLAEGLRSTLLAIEPQIRRDRTQARRDLLTAFHNLATAMGEAFGRMSDADARAAGEALARELHPYVMRSHLGELALDRPSGHVGDAHAMAHLLSGHATGDGPLGEVLDEWLLSMPTCRSFRERRAQAAQLVVEALPQEPPLRLMLVNAGSGALLAEVVGYLAGMAGEIFIVDGSRENLAFVDAGLPARPRGLKLRLVQDDLVLLCMGKSRIKLPPQDILVLDGLLEYLPERVAASALAWARSALKPGGALVLTALAPAQDDAVFRWLLSWPLVRRGRAAVAGLLAAAGFENVRIYEAGSAGIVAAGTAPARGRPGTMPLPPEPR